MTLNPPFLSRGLLVLALALPSLALAADAPSPLPSDWIPAGVEQLGRTAAFHTDFTFDRTMLQLASGLMDGGDPDARRAIAKLDGVTVHLYRYGAPGMYDPAQLDGIREQYRAAGWKHLVSTQSRTVSPSGFPNPPEVQGHIDLYLRMQGVDVTGMVVVMASPQMLNVVGLSGDLSPLDLLHLRGHFGIPKFAGDGFAPAQN